MWSIRYWEKRLQNWWCVIVSTQADSLLKKERRHLLTSRCDQESRFTRSFLHFVGHLISFSYFVHNPFLIHYFERKLSICSNQFFFLRNARQIQTWADRQLLFSSVAATKREPDIDNTAVGGFLWPLFRLRRATLCG